MGHVNQSRRRIITLLGGSAAVALACFAVWRAGRGDWVEAVFDLAIVLALAAIVWLARRGRHVERAGIAMCILSSSACLVGIVLVGDPARGWIYLALVSNFYIAPARVAAACSAALVGSASAVVLSAGIGAESLTTVATWILVGAFTYIFAFQVQLQQGTLEELAHVDPLTQVPNRRAMERQLSLALESTDPRRPGLLVVDIDRFKAVNDTWGHAAGDIVLESIAAVMRGELRRLDQVFRFGGEEFVVLLPVVSPQALVATGERIRAAIEASVRSPGGPVTISVGGALAGAETDWQNWFSRADAALYSAKRDGGNVVRVT